MKEKNLFIQKLVEHEKKFEHVGMTHDLLSIPEDFNLAKVEPLLKKIIKAPLRSIINNPYDIGKKQYLVTKELKQHVNAAYNLMNISQKFHKTHKNLHYKRKK
jgi:hypothetical protein